MRVLGIETSCDETAVAIVDSEKNILSNIIESQIDLHQKFGGVVPELAARNHIENIDKITLQALEKANLEFKDIDAIAATAGPGLIGGVIVGLTFAKSLASSLKKPFIAINHLEAHALTIRLTSEISFPYLLLLFSGGHCQILLAKKLGEYHKIGETIDDALGETFDKVAQMLGMKYPGGPAIEARSLIGDEKRFNFPLPLIQNLDRENLYNFSFSGLKTAIRRTIEDLTNENFSFYSYLKLSDKDIADICASFQKTAVKIIINRLNNIYNLQTIDNFQIPNQIVIAGGVAANQYIFSNINSWCKNNNLEISSPPIKLCTDNGVMIAWNGIEKLKQGITSELNFIPKARWEI